VFKNPGGNMKIKELDERIEKIEDDLDDMANCLDKIEGRLAKIEEKFEIAKLKLDKYNKQVNRQMFLD
jgi:chromosome segregation ATPase